MNVNHIETSFKAKLTQFVIDSSGVEDINEDTELFDSGIVNSLFAIQLMMFIEKNSNTKIMMDDLSLENFHSIARICQFLESRDT